MRNTKGPLVFLLILAAGALVAVVLHIAGHESSRDTDNPHEYDLTPYLATPAEVPRWREVSAFSLGEEKTTAFAVDAGGRIFALASNLIREFRPDGTPARSFPAPDRARCLAVEDEIFVGCGNHVEVLSREGKPSAVWPEPDSKTSLTSLAVRGDDAWGADFASRHVWHWDRRGKLLGAVATRDEQAKQAGLILPSAQCDVAATERGTVWVANTGRLRLEEYHASGRLLNGWGVAGMGISNFPGCCNPAHFALIPGIGFATGEKGILRAKVFSADGRFLALLAGSEDFAGGSPAPAVAADASGRVYVLDFKRNRLRIFRGGEGPKRGTP
ncbi:MAG: hypothetical protein J0L75_16580 [Spirochaetes bacterium]|nr:hypothetical protein [Spirochaetota bacterium]